MMDANQRSRARHVRNLVHSGYKVHEAVSIVVALHEIPHEQADYLWFVPEKLEVIYDAAYMRLRSNSDLARRPQG